ncbi:carboxymuconolactone decarboxylase family protein [Pantoea sp. 1.19]|uniref:carboxymuconolactone decarboxylase family protein n=1 Tax=Pantoea sp. 1.19 TaxID=1925589 RepID=UPI001F0A34E4|nr:carboxymuconolactone decarboxylase family protein [Pantoea sp. 1.19]
MTAPLNVPQQAMVKLAALTAYGDLVGLEMALHHGLDSGLTVNEIQEILVQLYAYCGFPRSLNALATLMAVVNARRQAGTRDPVGPTASPPPPDWDSLAAGRDNQTRLVGGPVTGGLFDFAPAIVSFSNRTCLATSFSAMSWTGQHENWRRLRR